jgi:aminoglycoside 3'-phosphotransferase-2
MTSSEPSLGAARIGLPDEIRQLLPASWRRNLVAYDFVPRTIGRSDALVFRLQGNRRPSLFLKTERLHPLAELPGEVARLRWLRRVGQPCPDVIDTATSDGRGWLMMSAVPGHDLASSPDLPAGDRVRVVAQALRDLHAIPASRCPFDHRRAQRVALALRRLDAGLVDFDDFDEANLGMSAAALIERLHAGFSVEEECVVTHGDAYLPNLVADGARFTGFVDCGRLGLSDRHQDLALAAYSIGRTLGAEWVVPFFAHYGGPIDPKRLAFYRLLDECF